MSHIIEEVGCGRKDRADLPWTTSGSLRLMCAGSSRIMRRLTLWNIREVAVGLSAALAAGMDASLKLHLRIAELPGQTYHVLTLRPSFGVRFSNNFFHETWHLLTDLVGAGVLARLWWGLSYQRQRGTVILLDTPHVVATPFEAAVAAPCLFSIAGSPTDVSLDEEHLTALRRWLRKPGPPATTVKLQTFGLTAELEREARGEGDERAERQARIAARRALRDAEGRPLWAQERMSKRAGLLCYTAPPEVLRWQALAVNRLPRNLHRGMNYHSLAEHEGNRRRGDCPPQGEVQVFSDFAERRSAARQGRMLTIEDPQRRTLSESEQARTWSAAARVLGERVAARQQRAAQLRLRACDPDRAALEIE
jgi:hypothetical protein